MKNRSIKITTFALTISVAMLLSYIESRVPAFVAIPGIKVGLANIAVIFTLHKFGARAAVTVSIIRVILIATLFGTPVSFIYSVSGATLSLILMILLRKLTPLTEIAVSVTGGVAHNIGQIAAASFMLSTNVVLYYLPFLLVSGTIAGIVVGVASAILVKRIKIRLK